MTDNEIIKAVECCSANDKCDNCPAYNLSNNCTIALMAETLDLISRQRAEIERLNQQIETAKFEAVKEFSKSLIGKTHGGKISSTDILDFVVDYLKERADNGNV